MNIYIVVVTSNTTMGLFDFFSRRKDEKPTISEEDIIKREEQRKIDRELAQRRRSLDLAIMAKQTELEKAKLDLELARVHEEIAELTGEEPEDESDELFSKLLDLVKSRNQNPSPNTSQSELLQESNSMGGVSLSDEEINAYIARVPPFIREQAKRASDAEIRAQILGVRKDLSEETIGKFISKLRV